MTEKIFMVSTISTEKQQLRFTKNNTLAIKGIAIIFLLCYHCFSDKGRLHGAAVSFWPLSEGTESGSARILLSVWECLHFYLRMD